MQCHKPIPAINPIVRRALELAYADPRPGKQIAHDAGLASDTAYRWRRRYQPTLPALEAWLGTLGYRLEIVPDETPDDDLAMKVAAE